MYVIRNIFHCKPGQAKALVAKFKAAAPHLERLDIHNPRILTDVSTDFWTVVIESESESLDHYFDAVGRRVENPELDEAMAGYMDLVAGGRREIFKLE